ncbi:MAG: SDR family NAD(P)-dependent oxidoreductase [Aestuariibacter sp.]
MLTDHHILLTGASRGIGAATLQQMLELGASVYANVRTEQDAKALREKVASDYQGRVHPLVYDVTDEQAVKQAFMQIQQQGVLTGLVNNAGIMHDASLAMTRMTDVEQQFNVNAKSVFQHTQLAARLMSRNKNGSIVNLNSQVAVQGSAGQSAYAMSKAAISGLTKSAAKELGPLNIRVNEVSPGFIETELTSEYSDLRRHEIAEQTSLRRLGNPEDVAKVICFLLSAQSGYITGQSIAVDGQINM